MDDRYSQRICLFHPLWYQRLVAHLLAGYADYVGLGDSLLGAALGVGLEDYDVAYARHPIQVVGVFVGHDAGHAVTVVAQRLRPRQRRAYGVAIGVGM